MPDIRETLGTASQLAGIVAAALVLPGALIDLEFGTEFLDVLSPAILAAFAVALMLAALRTHEQD